METVSKSSSQSMSSTRFNPGDLIRPAFTKQARDIHAPIGPGSRWKNDVISIGSHELLLVVEATPRSLIVLRGTQLLELYTYTNLVLMQHAEVDST